MLIDPSHVFVSQVSATIVCVGCPLGSCMVFADSDPLPAVPFDPHDPKFLRKYGLIRVAWQDRLAIHDAGSCAGVALVDVWTQVHANLPDGKWHAEFLDTDCVVIEDGSLQEMDPQLTLGRDLLCSRSGELFLCSVAKDGMYKVLESFDDSKSSHEVGTASLTTGSCAGVCKLGVSIFRIARHGRQRCWWSFNDLYQVLRLTSYQSVPTKWIWSCKASWRSMFQDMFFCV